MKLFSLSTLTARLGMLFALAALITFAGVGGYLYRSLASQLEARDDHELIGKVDQIRHLLSETPSIQAIRKDPHRFIDATGQHEGLIMILQAPNGEEIMRNGNAPAEVRRLPLPTMPSVASDKLPENASLRSWELPSDSSARVVAAWGKLNHPNEEVRIILARTDSDRMDLLGTYKRSVFGSIIGGSLLAAMLGYFVVSRSMKPVRHIASQARSISAEQFDKRLNASAAPGELQILVESFNAVLNRLQDSFQRLSQFSGDLAHDMRTPLNNLMVQTQVALSQPRSIEEYQVLLGSNFEEYERMARMVESMLFLARADHAQVILEKHALDATEELHRIAEYFEGVAEDAGVRFEIIVGRQATVWADPVLFRRAVNNLMANAIRFTGPGGVIQLACYSSVTGQIISVSNPGEAIDAQDLPRLFDRFYRADQVRAQSATSAGLGLAIVQSIMKLHGGWAEVESIPEGMTQFRLIFPFEQIPHTTNAEQFLASTKPERHD